MSLAADFSVRVAFFILARRFNRMRNRLMKRPVKSALIDLVVENMGPLRLNKLDQRSMLIALYKAYNLGFKRGKRSLARNMV